MPRKKRHTALIVILVLVALVLCALAVIVPNALAILERGGSLL